ncbi:hypothetical protein CPB85DRAFT_1250174 [Mucidula mucida]|nr:hypothetical protein CPB85DRAFT_1250174 [Mucidula mucida]
MSQQQSMFRDYLARCIHYIITLIVDVVVYTQLPPILLKFATGHLWMRLRYGFRPVEIVFRKPTGAQHLKIKDLPPQEYHTAYMNSILHAIDARLLNHNVGYNTRDGFWVLEYTAAIDAFKLAQTGKIPIETWELSVWQKIEGKWSCDGVQKLHSLGKQDILDEWVATLQTQDQSQVMALKDIQSLEALLSNVGLNFTTLSSASGGNAPLAVFSLVPTMTDVGMQSLIFPIGWIEVAISPIEVPIKPGIRPCIS